MGDFMKDLAVVVISSLVIVAAETALKVLREKDLSQSRQARKEVLEEMASRKRCPAIRNSTLGAMK